MSFLLRKAEDVTTISESQSLTSVSMKDCTLRVPNKTTTLFLVLAIMKAIFIHYSCFPFLILLHVLRIQHVILVSGLCRLKRRACIFPQNCLTTTNVVKRLITSIGCRPCSGNLLCFRKWPNDHFIFCRWLRSIIVFTVPSCLPR